MQPLVYTRRMCVPGEYLFVSAERINVSMKVKLIALDLDGTTLNSKNQLTERTRQALILAAEQGVEIVPVTGRCFKSLPPELLALDCIRYAVVSNGAEIRNAQNGEILYNHYIDPSGVQEIRRLLHKKELMVEVYVKGSAYMEHAFYEKVERSQISYRNRDYVLATRVPVRGVLQLLDVHRTRIEKVAVYFEAGSAASRRKEELAEVRHACVTSSGHNNMELIAQNCSKARTLEVLCRMLGISLAEVMAAGDSQNDLEMLEAAGVSVAMGNGDDNVKACADYIALTNDCDGLAEAISLFIE